MKKILLLSALIVFLFGCKSKDGLTKDIRNRSVDSTRTNTYVIEYDFKKGIYTSNNLQLCVNTPTVFKIININRLAYNITISSNDTILAETAISDDAKLTSASDLSKLNNIDKINLLGKASNLPNMNVSTIDQKEDFIKNDNKNAVKNFGEVFNDLQKIPEVERLVAERIKFENKLDSLNVVLEIRKSNNQKEVSFINLKDSLLKLKENLKVLDVSDTIRRAILNQEIKSLEAEIMEAEKKVAADVKSLEATEKNKEDLSKKIIQSNKDIQKLSESLKNEIKKFNEDNIALQESFNKLSNAYNIILNFKEVYTDIKTIADYPYQTDKNYANKHKEEVSIKVSKVLSQKELMIHFKDIYMQFGVKYSRIKYNPYLSQYLNYGGQTKLYAQAEFIKTLADIMNNEVKDIKLEEMLQKLQHTVEYLEDSQTYQYVSAPIQPTQDAAIFKVKIEKKLDNHAAVTDEKSFNHTEFTYGGSRVDFSIGLAGSYFANAKVYEFGVRNDSTTLSKKSNTLIAPALVGLITMSYRRTQYMAFGASAGLGIDVVNGKVELSNFFVGPTILFGKYDRLFLTGGLSLRNVQQLKSGYQDGDTVTAGADDINNYLSDKYKIGTFLSLTYNLTKGVRANVKKLK